MIAADRLCPARTSRLNGVTSSKAVNMTKADVYQFISKQKLGVLSSVSSAGTPQSALVGIAVTPELEIIFDTVMNSRKARNLMANPLCSFVIGWAGETTVQYEGTGHTPKEPRWHVTRRYISPRGLSAKAT